MSGWKTFSVILLLLALTGGCSDQLGPTGSDNPVTGPQFDLSDRPDVVGVVLRGDWALAVGFTNVEDALVSVHSTSYPPLPSWAASCSPTTDVEPLYWQDVLSPSGKWHELWKAPKAFVAIYDASGWPDMMSCDFWSNVTGRLLAEGQVQWIYVDNDVTGGAGWGGTGANSYQIKASGNVTNVTTGQSHGYQMKRMWQILPDGRFLSRGAGPALNPDPR